MAAPSSGSVLPEIFGKITGAFNGLKLVPQDSTVVTEQASNMGRQEIIAKLISSLIGLTASMAVTYFGIKWLSNALDPTREEKKESQQRAEKLMKSIGLSGIKLSEYELCIASNLVDPLSMTISWENIGGLDDIVEEIQETIIFPFQQRHLLASSALLQAPKGVLLYGPPGCGKTMIAKATAKASGARFINLQVSALVDKWYGESQKRAEAVFSLAIKLQPTIIFIDEIDSFLRSRTSSDHEATAMVKTQFMSFWDGLVTDPNCQVMIMGATNRPQDVDAAILRRMPSMFYVGLPDVAQRERILKLILLQEYMDDDLDIRKVAEACNGFSGSDLREVCRNAAIVGVRDFMRAERERLQNASDLSSTDSSSLRPITMGDMISSARKLKESKLLLPLHGQVDLD